MIKGVESDISDISDLSDEDEDDFAEDCLCDDDADIFEDSLTSESDSEDEQLPARPLIR